MNDAEFHIHSANTDLDAVSSLEKRNVLMGIGYVNFTLCKAGLNISLKSAFILKNPLYFNKSFYILTNVKIFLFSIWKI